MLLPLGYFTRLLDQPEENSRQKSRSCTKHVKRKVASSCPSGDEVFLALFPSIAIMLIYHGWQQYLKKKTFQIGGIFQRFGNL